MAVSRSQLRILEAYAAQLPPREAWETIQGVLSDLPGAFGMSMRARFYRPYFARFGRGVRIDRGCLFYFPDRISLDDDVRINVGALIYGSGGVTIGRHARIGPRFFLHSANHDVADDGRAFFEQGYEYASTHIGDNCLISANVSVLPGVSLGSGSFVAAGGVVTRGDYPDEARLFGMPARLRDPSPPPTPAPHAASISKEIDNADADRASHVWVTPIHFPLEGTTRDTTLDYFDRLVSQFRDLLRCGGHVIVGSHPDLNQKILSDLIGRENLAECWCAPVADVVTRYRKVMEYGNIKAETDGGEVRLVSSQTLADVQVEWTPLGDTSPRIVVTQLCAGRPRQLELPVESASECHRHQRSAA